MSLKCGVLLHQDLILITLNGAIPHYTHLSVYLWYISNGTTVYNSNSYTNVDNLRNFLSTHSYFFPNNDKNIYMFITGRVWDDNNLGRAYLNKTSGSHNFRVGIANTSQFDVALAHEIGHTLGLNHYNHAYTCDSGTSDGFHYSLMHPYFYHYSRPWVAPTQKSSLRSALYWYN